MDQVDGERVERDEVILQASEELFCSRGFHEVGVDEIGERAGISGPAIYRHFASKEEILVTLFDRALDQLLDLRSGMPKNPQARLEFLAKTHVAFLLSHHQLASVWIREDRGLPRELASRHHRRSRGYIDEWVDCVAQVYPDRSREQVVTATYCVIGMANSIATWHRPGSKVPHAKTLLPKMVISGLDRALGPLHLHLRSTAPPFR